MTTRLEWSLMMSRFLTLHFKKEISATNPLNDTKYYMNVNGRWEPIDRNLYIDFRVIARDDQSLEGYVAPLTYEIKCQLDIRQSRIMRLVLGSYGFTL